MATDFTATPKSLICCDVWDAYDGLCNSHDDNDRTLLLTRQLDLHQIGMSDVSSIPVNAQQGQLLFSLMSVRWAAVHIKLIDVFNKQSVLEYSQESQYAKKRQASSACTCIPALTVMQRQ